MTGLRNFIRLLLTAFAIILTNGARAEILIASWYGGGEYLNARTANGERFRPMGFTTAHRTLPFGTRLRVCFARCAIVRVNDRGPATRTGRSLDLSKGAAIATGLYSIGVGRVDIEALP